MSFETGVLMRDDGNPLAAQLSDGERERLARRIIRNPRSKPDDVRAARYALCEIEHRRKHSNNVAASDLPPLR